MQISEYGSRRNTTSSYCSFKIVEKGIQMFRTEGSLIFFSGKLVASTGSSLPIDFKVPQFRGSSKTGWEIKRDVDGTINSPYR